jgi:putative SOS response-associated peptidase YedK
VLPIYTISSRPETVQEQCKLAGSFLFSPIYQARPGMKLPILLLKDKQPEWIMAKWAIKRPVVSMDRIITTRPYNILVRKQRCAIPANCFFSMKNGSPHLIRLLQYRLFLLGGIFYTADEELHFAILETDPADILRSMEGQMPVVMAPEKLSSWLCGDEISHVIHCTDKSCSYWFDYFPVSKNIRESTQNNKYLLKPEGISQQALKEYEKKMAALAFDKERPDRSNLKH